MVVPRVGEEDIGNGLLAESADGTGELENGSA